MVLMKKLIFILTSLAILSATGCKKEEKPIDCNAVLPGEWHCAPGGFDADIYVAFNEDGSFDLYQQTGDGRHRHYTGNWTCEGSTLSGTYADGTTWGSSYKAMFKDEDTMTLTALNGSKEVMTYVREAVPSEVIEGCIEVRSSLRMLNSQPQYSWL